MWLPRSTCDAGCLPRPGEVARVPTGVVLWRLCAVFAVVLVAAVVLPLLPAARVPLTLQRTARAVLAAVGVRHAARGRLAQRRALIVANHVSWLDILLLLAYAPCRLIAKHEVRDWPVIGRLAAAAGTVFIDRSRPRTLPGTVTDVADALRGDAVVAVFPEGTTWCGRNGGRFHPAMFQAAVAAGAVVAPVSLAFETADGSPTTVAAFVGDDTLFASLMRVVAARGLTITLRAYSPLYPTEASSRRVLAAAARAVISPMQPEPVLAGPSHRRSSSFPGG
jgi:1-acyl-sn-glycerol-3-phosphate acyltransferase